MELETIEKEDRLLIDMKQNHTIGNLLRKAVWENNGEAAYDKGHPFETQSNLVIDSDNTGEVLKDSVETAREWVEEVKAEL